MKIKTVKMYNGDFAVCPNCGKLMARGRDWWCVSGCGLKIKKHRRG